MNMEKRVEKLERRTDKLLENREPSVTGDQVLEKLGLDPALVRQEAHDSNCSVVEVVCRYLGLEMREFKRILRERANLQ